MLLGDERRRGMRREDPRRHTLGGDMLAYANQPNQQQPKSMDLEVIKSMLHTSTVLFVD